jgi:hypothetical protein
MPGPETIKEVEVLRNVPGPVEYQEKIVYRDVPGPIEYRPAPGPIEYRDVPGPERIVTKTVEVVKEVPVPGPERVVIEWEPYDINTGLRIKTDGSLGEKAQIRAVQ